MEHRPAVNFPTAADYSLVLQLIRESMSRSCWWNPDSSGLLYSGLIDTFPKGCVWSKNKQQHVKQKMRISKGKVHLENRSSLWFLPLISGISLLPCIWLSCKSTSPSTCSWWHNWDSKKSIFRGYRKPEWAESNFPTFLFPEIPEVHITNYYSHLNSTKILRYEASDSLIQVWPNQPSAPSRHCWVFKFLLLLPMGPSVLSDCCPLQYLSLSKCYTPGWY